MEFKHRSVTIKIGSNVLTRDDGKIDSESVSLIADQIAFLHNNKLEVVLVSSGAVAAGRTVLKKTELKDSVSSRQLLSSVGQVRLLSDYSSCFQKHGINCAQVLVTKQDFRTREHYLNMKNCLEVLLKNNILPIINENDAVSVTELMFTDNDELAGMVAGMLNSEALFLMTSVDGIYDGKPTADKSELIKEIDCISFDPESVSANEKSSFGRGGMLTKARVAKNMAAMGISVYIANGRNKDCIIDLAQKGADCRCSKFKAQRRSAAIKKWMASSSSFTEYQIEINKGAVKALYSDRAVSILLSGVTSLKGDFKKGDLLKIVDQSGKILGVGKAQYDSKTAQKHMDDKKYKPVIHYDYLFLFPN